MTAPVVDHATTITPAPAWLDRRLVVAHDGGSQFVCPKCGPSEGLLSIVNHWSHLASVERLLFRGQLAIVGEGPEVDEVVEWLDHLGFSLAERDALRLITTQEFALDADAWDIATTAETERRRRERLAARAASAATPRDELVTLSAHPAPYVHGPALATLTELRERRSAGDELHGTVPPRWLKSEMLRQQGRSVRIFCSRCRQSFAPLVKHLELHIGHISAVDRVLLVGQVEAGIARDPRGLLARELVLVRDWIVRTACTPASREAAVSEVLAYLPRETVPAFVSDLELRRLAVKAESVRFALARDLRQARKSPEAFMLPGEPNARLLEYPVDFIRSTAQQRLADYQVQLAELENEGIDDALTPNVAVDLEDEPNPTPAQRAFEGESVSGVGEQASHALITRVEAVAAAIGATVKGTRRRIGGGDVWILRDPRPYVGGTIIAVDYGETVPDAGDVRRVVEGVDIEGAVRGLVIGGSFTSEIESLAWRRPISLITAADVDLMGTQNSHGVRVEFERADEEDDSTVVDAVDEGRQSAPSTSAQPARITNVRQPAVDSVTEQPTLDELEPDWEPSEEAPVGAKTAPVEEISTVDLTEQSQLAPLADRLLESARFQEQRAAVGRHAPDADFIRRIVRAAEDYQSSVPWNSFVAALGTSDAGARMRLPVLRRLLNVDGYDAVDPAEAEGLVRVDLALLRAQFGLR